MLNPDLIHHNKTQFKKSIVQLAPHMWTAVGYAASTQHMIEGEASITIIDTSESTAAAKTALAKFRAISDKPILASAALSSDLVGQDYTTVAPTKALNRRTLVQFGIGLSPQERISLGCGPGNRPMEGMGAGHIPPNQLIERDKDINLDGVQARLVMALDETAVP